MGAYQPDRQDAVQRVKEAADIVEIIGEHVSLKRAGASYKGLCPFHAEKTPSFVVNPARNTFHCFGCGEGGDVLSFLTLYHRITFPEALKQLAARYQITLPEKPLNQAQQAEARQRERLFEANAKAAALYRRALVGPEGGAARAYLDQRGMPAAISERFQLGYAPDGWDFLSKALAREKITPAAAQEAGLLVAKEGGRGFYDRFRDRIMFPIIDLTGRVAGFGGRILGAGEPKYLNTPETPAFDKGRTLFGLYQNREAIRKARRCLVVEGNFDLLSLVAHGVETVVAPLGTALTAGHLRMLRGYVDEAILLFDGDTAGFKAALRAVPIFLAEKVTGRIAVLPKGHDPDTFVRERGAEGIAALVEAARPLPEFIFDKLAAEHGLGVDGKNRIIAELAPIVHALGDQLLLRTRFIAHFSERLGISADQFAHSIGRPVRPAPAHTAPAGAADEAISWQLTRNEEDLFTFLLLHGDYREQFLAAGLREAVTSPAAHALLALIDQAGEQFSEQPEILLDLAAIPARSMVSRLLTVSASACLPENREERATELLAWLRQQAHRKDADRLVREISAAYQAGDEELLTRLMSEKKAMDVQP